MVTCGIFPRSSGSSTASGCATPGCRRRCQERGGGRRPAGGAGLADGGRGGRWWECGCIWMAAATLVRGATLVRPAGDSGRRHQGDYYAPLGEEASPRTVLAGIREVLERKGVFCARYADRASPFLVTPQAGGAGGSDSADAGGPGAAGPGNGTAPRLFAAGARAQRTPLPHRAGATAAGAARARDYRTAGGP